MEDQIVTSHTLMPFGRYVRLFMLHRVETAAEELLVRVRVETLRYSLLPLHEQPLDVAYADDPRAGAELVRSTVQPRLQALLDAHDPWSMLELLPARDTAWQEYAAARGLPAATTPVSTISIPSPRQLPARTTLGTRLAQTQRALELLHTGIETVSAAATLWQNWQIGRAQARLLVAQRDMLYRVIEGQVVAQDAALSHGLDTGYVRGYLADHRDDEAYRAVFGPNKSGSG